MIGTKLLTPPVMKCSALRCALRQWFKDGSYFETCTSDDEEKVEAVAPKLQSRLGKHFRKET